MDYTFWPLDQTFWDVDQAQLLMLSILSDCSHATIYMYAENYFTVNRLCNIQIADTKKENSSPCQMPDKQSCIIDCSQTEKTGLDSAQLSECLCEEITENCEGNILIIAFRKVWYHSSWCVRSWLKIYVTEFGKTSLHMRSTYNARFKTVKVQCLSCLQNCLTVQSSMEAKCSKRSLHFFLPWST